LANFELQEPIASTTSITKVMALQLKKMVRGVISIFVKIKKLSAGTFSLSVGLVSEPKWYFGTFSANNSAMHKASGIVLYILPCVCTMPQK